MSRLRHSLIRGAHCGNGQGFLCSSFADLRSEMNQPSLTTIPPRPAPGTELTDLDGGPVAEERNKSGEPADRCQPHHAPCPYPGFGNRCRSRWFLILLVVGLTHGMWKKPPGGRRASAPKSCAAQTTSGPDGFQRRSMPIQIGERLAQVPQVKASPRSWSR